MPLHIKAQNVWRSASNVWIKVSGTWRSSLFWLKTSSTWRPHLTTTPATPTLTQVNNADGTYSVSTTSYSVLTGAGGHASTDWQIAARTDTTFSSPVYSSSANTVNLTSLNLHDKGLSDSTQYIMRARFRATDSGTGAWSTTYDIFTPPEYTISNYSYNSHLFSLSTYNLTGYSHSNSDYAITKTTDTSFSSPGLNVTGQVYTAYYAGLALVGNSAYLFRARANLSGGRVSAYKVQNLTTGSFTFTNTYTSNASFTTPFSPSGSTATIYVEAGGSRAGGGCNSDGYGARVGGNLVLPQNTAFNIYPGNIGGGGGCACGGGGGAGSVFASTSSVAYLIAGGGGSVRQCCHCCGCDCDGCGGGGGYQGGYNLNGTYGCGSGAGGSWGGTVDGTNQVTTRGNFGAGGGSACQGGSNYIGVTPTVNTYHTGGAYVYISF